MHGESAITVFFDGQCPICSREVALYRRLDRRARIGWRDLNRGADVLRGETFSLAEAMTLLHVKDRDGTLRIGVAAHLCMWQQLPWLCVPARWISQSAFAIRWLEIAYLFFTRYRPGLSRARRRP